MDTKKMVKIADKEANKAVKKHEGRMHKMAKGGVTSEMMKAMGRNMARAKNQGSK